MGFFLNGYVLNSARYATGNSPSSGEAKSNISREHILPSKMTSLGYDIIPSVPVEPCADMYSAGVLDAPKDSTQYAIFAANTSSFSVVESIDVSVLSPTQNIVLPLSGSVSVGSFDDGTKRFAIKDENARDLSGVVSLVIVRGDNSAIVTCSSFTSFNIKTSTLQITNTDAALLGGGFSVGRGDVVSSVVYNLSAPRYFWTRNDNRKTRFYWNGGKDRWEPIPGKTPQNVGIVLEDGEYKLFPPLETYQVGEVLPFPSSSDEYCILRYGLYADSTSEPLYVLVVSDSLADAGSWRADLGWNTYQAVVGVTNGKLLLNPSFIQSETGLTIWYNAETFSTDNDGILIFTQELDTDTNINHPILSPVPEPGEYPFVRIGYRSYLTAKFVDSDSELPDPLSVNAGEFFFSLTTGKTCFSSADIKKAKPGNSEYQKSYLLSKIYFDGVVLSSEPVPIRKPVPLLNPDGDPLDGNYVVEGAVNFLPVSSPLPPPGVSGVMLWEDSSGDEPNLSADPQTRPNGSGLKRKIVLGDSFFFNEERRFVDTAVKEYDEDLSNLNFTIPTQEVEVSRMISLTQPTGYTDTSSTKLKKSKAKGSQLYFIQTGVSPSSYVEKAKIFSRVYEPYVFDGTESFTFAIDGSIYSINLPQGSFTAQEMASILNSLLPSPTCGHFRGRVFISNSDPNSGSVEIGYNIYNDELDFRGHGALGFLPTWRIEPGNADFRWLPDTGSFLELYRSPTNLDGKEGSPDCKAVIELNDKILENSIFELPFQSIDNIPLEDVPGYDDGVHFRTTVGLLEIDLPNYGFESDLGIIYDFDESRLSWTALNSTPNTQQTQYKNSLALDDFDIVPETLASASMGSPFGLYYKPIGVLFSELIAGQDYLLLDGGASGEATLIDVISKVIEIGSGGEGSGNQFSNPKYTNNASQNTALQNDLFNNVEVGFLLEVQNTDSVGVYTITSKSQVLGVTSFEVTPSFPENFTKGIWRIFNAKEYSELDYALVSDVKGFRRNHFPEEPFKINLLSLVGQSGSSLEADVRDAVELSRETAIRIGLPAGSTELTTYFLKAGIEVGIVQPSGLSVPDLSDPHFTESSGSTAYFQLRIGGDEFNTSTGNLTLDAGVTPTTVDVNTTTGEILIGEDLVSDLASASIYYDQLFRDSTNISGVAEIDAQTGFISIPSSVPSGQDIYFIERLVTEQFQDVVISPMNGGIFLNNPLKTGQIVEADYFLADSAGDKKLDENGDPIHIIEFLSHIIRLEECTRVDGFTYTFNSTGNTTSQEVEPFVWSNSQLQNYAGSTTVNIDLTSNTLTFVEEQESSYEVKINYGVLEARGGEQSLSVTTPPVYRKPFFLNARQSSFDLETDRTEDFGIGKVMSIGSNLLYITSSTYNAGTDKTTVTIFPTPVVALGSNSPGRDQTLTTSDFPVDVQYGGPAGYMLSLSASYKKLAKNSPNIVFVGDLTETIKPNHIFEIGGRPYLVSSSTLSEDGLYTQTTLASFIVDTSDSQSLRISARPLQLDPLNFTVPKTPVPGETLELFIIGRKDANNNPIPGIKLIPNLDYSIAGSSISLLQPYQTGLKEEERLYAAYTSLVKAGPEIRNNAIVSPIYKGRYLTFTEPSKQNRLKGAKLRGKYKYSQPDCFFFEIIPLTEYLPKVTDELISSASGGGSGGFVSNNTTDPSVQGSLGTRAEVQDFKNKDRAARTYIELYNKIIVSFEQILEAMNGQLIGDRDGKFRMFVGHNRKYAPPGWEDEFTGNINPRLVWREVLESWADASLLLDGYYNESDPVVNPVTAFEKDPVNRPGDVDGETPDPDILSTFIAKQRLRIKNDMDDRVLVGFAKPRFLAALFPSIDVPGRFKFMWEPQVFSRLFPERTKHFSRLFPGVNAVVGPNGFTDPGFYTPGRTETKPGPNPGEEEEVKVSTKGNTIGTISNPAIGQVTGIVDVTAQERFNRARVWAFYPEGSQDLDDVVGSTTVGKATLVLSQVPLSQFPTEKGFPDTARLISEGGETLDLVSGDNVLAIPPLQVGQRINYGKPNGSLYELLVGDLGVYVEEIQLGCIITLMDGESNSIIGSDIVVNSSSNLEDVISKNDGLGDTCFVVPPNNFEEVPADDESATVEQLEEIAGGIPDIRIQFDMKVDKRSGEFIDSTLPTKDDDFPINLQSLFGQKPPLPLQTIEGGVSFVNSSTSPVKLPCLFGEGKDDSGDNQIPYIRGSGSEIEILSRLNGDMTLLFEDMNFSPLPNATPYSAPYGTFTEEYQYWNSVYPDEFVINDGVYYFEQDGTHNPATLYFSRNVRPIETTGTYSENSGVGSLRKYDLLFIEVNQNQLPYHAFEGIHTVGDVSNNSIEIPRFVASTPVGTEVRYTARNYAGHKGFSTASGVFVTEVVVGVTRTVTFDFSSVPDFQFTGENAILNRFANIFVINCFDSDPAGTGYRGSILLGNPVSGSTFWTIDSSLTIVAGVLTGTGISFTANTVSFEMNSAAAPPLTLMGLASGGTYDFTLEIDTYIDNQTRARTGSSLAVGSGNGSVTSQIMENRLTFSENLDFRSAFPRDTFPANGSSYDMNLEFGIYNFLDSSGLINSVNSIVQTNNNSPFTLLERVGPDPQGLIPAGQTYVGTYDSLNAVGYIRMMSWERGGNITWGGSDVDEIILSVAPSSDIAKEPDPANNPIAYGTGICYDEAPLVPLTTNWETEGPTTWIQNAVVTSGNLSQIQSGDIVILNSGKSRDGTYLVRHTVADSNFLDEDGERVFGVRGFANAGTKNAFDLRFPKIRSVNTVFPNYEIVLEDVEPVPGSPSGHGWHPTAPYIFVIRKDTYASYSGAAYTVDPDSVWRIDVGSFLYDPVGKTLTCTSLTSPRKADGTFVGVQDFLDGISKGQKVSGMEMFSIGKIAEGLPDNNCVGAHTVDGGGFIINLQGGVFSLTAGNTSAFHPTTPSKNWNSLTGNLLNKDGAPTSGTVAVNVPAPVQSNDFIEDVKEVIYARSREIPSTTSSKTRGVANHVDFISLTNTEWNEMHFDGAAPTNILFCLLPKDKIVFGSDIDHTTGQRGFFAQQGIFLEPSFPQPVTTGFSSTFVNDPRVVTQNNPFGVTPNSLVGMRNTSDFTSPVDYFETVNFIVRRIRRFHEVQTKIENIAEDLQYIYEMRRGETSAASGKTFTAAPLASGLSTNVGNFDDPLVNINPGDMLRIYNSSGEIVAESEIKTVVSATELELRQEVPTIAFGSPFEVYLKQATVPHEQSLNELLEYITDEVIFERTLQRINPAENGGQVALFNKLKDTGITNWSSTGVQEGDYIIVDPQGELYLPNESGNRPEGDLAITDGGQDRVAHFGSSGVVTVFTPNKPNGLDDNRGFYLVGELDPAQPDVLPVDGTNKFAGGSDDGSDNIIFGSIVDYAAGEDYRYALLPTISSSTIGTTTTEGQQALRPTSPPVGNSYNARVAPFAHRSIEPFGYKIIRPSSLFSKDAIELVLFMRERNLSFIEEIRSLYNGSSGGTYYVFQRDDHILDIGSPLDPSSGSGVIHNGYMQTLQGLVSLAPYVSSSDCLSILGRRVHISDFNLDLESPAGSPVTYTELVSNDGDQRPVYPDYIADVLNLEDNLRGKRYAWLNTRVNLSSGSATQAQRAEDSLPEEIQKERELVEQLKDAEK